MSLKNYKKQSLSAGWTRVEMLLEVYDHAITSVDGCQSASESEDATSFTRHYIAASKALLAIHSGLEPHKDEVAFNVARLLHFVVTCFDERKYAEASKVLNQLREGFAAVAEEVNQLERDGAIPPVRERDCYQSTA
ncbi:hypothetical protein [Planctomycetes bacterium K23_9]|uniref:Flagellar protein FliS n=1 Tax=Stieleria marina TaxID=1930275 RepID=A0A517NXN0_9BACT|nr:hypothetical protein K239x_38840 [Planctomycetes bacterium K23_9]